MIRLVALVALTGCWKSAPRPGPMPTTLEASAHDPSGAYWCSIDDEKNLEFRCEITKRAGALHIEKVSGAERIRGTLTLNGDTLDFQGERFCMWENCTSKLIGAFVPTERGNYRGTFKDAPLVVRLAPMPAGSAGNLGGQAYGGGTYGAVDTGGPGAP